MKNNDKQKNNLLQVFGGIVGVLTICGLLIAILQLWQSLSDSKAQENTQSTLIAISEKQLMAQQTLVALQQNSSSPQQIADIKSTIAVLENERLVVQSTLTPGLVLQTNTPESTTSIPQSTNTSSFLSFNDDFERGIKPDWEIMYGNLGMANGRFTVTSPFEKRQDFHLAILGNYEWTNYRMEIILAEFSGFMSCFPCPDSAASGIVIRYDPEGSSIGLLLIPAKRQIAFAKLDNANNWSIINNTLVGDWHLNTINLDTHPNKVVIEATSDTYFVYVDGQQMASATIPGPIIGQVGLWFSNSSRQNTPHQFAASYESFDIQETP